MNVGNEQWPDRIKAHRNNRTDERMAQLAGTMQFSGNAREDMTALLAHHGLAATAEHCLTVADEARRLADRFGIEGEHAAIGGWLHDVSAVIPSPERAEVARRWDLPVLPEEDVFPMILHQKLSAVMARVLFGVADEAILNAIACHTTLRTDATVLDKVVFLADKVQWDGIGEPPYLSSVLAGLRRSLDAAVFAYLDYLWQQRAKLAVLHPWAAAAHQQLAERVS